MCRRSLDLTGVCHSLATTMVNCWPCPWLPVCTWLRKGQRYHGQSCRIPTFSAWATGWIAHLRELRGGVAAGLAQQQGKQCFSGHPQPQEGTTVETPMAAFCSHPEGQNKSQQHQCWQSWSDFLLDSFYGQSWLSKGPDCYSWDAVKKSCAANSAHKIKNKKEDLCLPLIVRVFPQALQAACPSCWDGWLQQRR